MRGHINEKNFEKSEKFQRLRGDLSLCEYEGVEEGFVFICYSSCLMLIIRSNTQYVLSYILSMLKSFAWRNVALFVSIVLIKMLTLTLISKIVKLCFG